MAAHNIPGPMVDAMGGPQMLGIIKTDGSWLKGSEPFGMTDARNLIGKGGHQGEYDDMEILIFKKAGVRGFRVMQDGRVFVSPTFGAWEPNAHIFMNTIQDWANGFEGAPELMLRN